MLNTMKLKLLKLSLLSIFMLSACTSHNEYLDKLNGLYGGVGKQSDGGAWVIKINMNSGSYDIEYPLMSSGNTCAGRLDYAYQSDDRFYFDEKINSGKCKSDTIYLTELSDGGLEYHWGNSNSVKLKKYASNNELISDTRYLFNQYKEESGSNWSTRDTLTALAGVAAAGLVVAGAYCLLADCSSDDTSYQSGSYDDDVRACQNRYVGERISIPTGKKFPWGELIYNQYDVKGVGKVDMTVEEVYSKSTFKINCSTSRFKPY